MLLIGSTALNIQYPGLLNREPKDLDLIGTYSELQFLAKQYWKPDYFKVLSGNKVVMKRCHHIPAKTIVEFEIAWPDSTAEQLLNLVNVYEPPILQRYWETNVFIPSMDILLALKTTHRFVSNVHFKKTMADWNLLKKEGTYIPDYLHDWVKVRTKETLKNHPKLNVSKKDFFNPEQIDYVYDHDSIHRAVAYGEVPAYTRFQRPGSEVKCDRELFDAQSLEHQLHSVAEESYVLAIERSHVPHGTLTPKKAFDIALEKVCTVISSGWWREFAYTNYDKVQAVYRDDYVDRFYRAVECGDVPPFNHEKTY